MLLISRVSIISEVLLYFVAMYLSLQFSMQSSPMLLLLDHLKGSIEKFTTSAERLWLELQKVSDDPSDLSHVRRLNYQLMQLERAFIVPEGLPGRPFYKLERGRGRGWGNDVSDLALRLHLGNWGMLGMVVD